VKLLVRPAEPDDLEAVRRLVGRASLIPDGVLLNFTPPLLVMERDGEVVGAIQALLGKPVAVITFAVVAAEHRRKGYGIRLLQAMELLLRDYGLTSWVAFTGSADLDTAKMLIGLGAKATGNGEGWVKMLGDRQ
jgi:N-acetylglutamate synthase-like GNAT family acetyltransferase